MRYPHIIHKGMIMLVLVICCTCTLAAAQDMRQTHVTLAQQKKAMQEKAALELKDARQEAVVQEKDIKQDRTALSAASRPLRQKIRFWKRKTLISRPALIRPEPRLPR